MSPEASTIASDRSVEDLKRELAEACRREAATADILRVISRSPTDLQSVLDAVAKSAARLCEAETASVFRCDGDQLRLVANHRPLGPGIVGEYTIPLIRGTANGRAVLERRTIHIADLQSEAREYPEGSETARKHGHRTVLAVPLLREGIVIGSISLRRASARLFTAAQVALVETFAGQAVIAIENTRLFEAEQARTRELAERTQELTEAREYQICALISP
jgi:two-component system, NtrC family, sensor kinase